MLYFKVAENMDKIKTTDDLIKNISNLKQNEVLKFKIQVNASAKSNSIEFTDEFVKIRIKEKAIEGRANKAIVEYLSDILKIPKKQISIISGQTSRLKVVQIQK